MEIEKSKLGGEAGVLAQELADKQSKIIEKASEAKVPKSLLSEDPN